MGDREIMGTAEEAQAKLVEATRAWREFRQPLMANAAAHRKRDALETEARFRLANAALLWLWHVENPEPGNAEESSENPASYTPTWICHEMGGFAEFVLEDRPTVVREIGEGVSLLLDIKSRQPIGVRWEYRPFATPPKAEADHAPDCQSHIVDVRGRPDPCTCGANGGDH